MWNEWISCAAHLLAMAVTPRANESHANDVDTHESFEAAIERCDELALEQRVPAQASRCIRLLACRVADDARAASGSSRPRHEPASLERRYARGTTVDDVIALVDDLCDSRALEPRWAALLHDALALSTAKQAYTDTEPDALERQRLESARRRLAERLLASRPAVMPTRIATAVPAPPMRWRDRLPVWVVAASGGVVLTLLFVAMRVSINAHSDPVFASLRAIDVRPADLPASSPALSPAVAAALAPRLATFLKQDIDAGLVLVNDMPDKSVVTIKSDSFFEPGSAVIADPTRMSALMGRIAAGLNAVPGQALVAGYTDARHDHSVLYPSNWHLSQDRATVVASILAESVDPARLTAQGRADSEPIGDNATPRGRAENRRVDITLVTGQPS